MTTPTPEEQAGDAFAAAAAEAVQASVAAVRLVLAVADAVRRHQQRRAGREEEAASSAREVAEASGEVKKSLPPDISAALVADADWPRLAQQLVALRRAGVDLELLLPRIGEITVTVRDQVAATAERVARERADEWVKALRETLPAGPVREAILTSPTWPETAATMAKLDKAGADVRAILASAYEEGAGVDQAVAAGEAPIASRDAKLSYGPLTTGLDIPRDLNLGNRERALRQLAIASSENERFVRMVREAMPGLEQEAGLLVAARQWPLIAARMAYMEDHGQPVAEHLARLSTYRSWQEGPPSQVGQRLVQAASDALCRPVGAPTGARVSTVAARATSPSVGPTKAAKAAAPPDAGVAPHRQSAPAPSRGRSK
ncbi:hypothetical protein [Streptomyces misionensis]|uniref:hypothetical protein n=1 Tax=Streptomyces misionensis TaxID=67331 RepID=UPI0033FF48FE